MISVAQYDNGRDAMKAIVIFAVLLAVVQARSAHSGSPHRSSVRSELEDPYGLTPQIGTSIDAGASRIVNGNTASRGQFPYQVAIYVNGVSFCAGSLISRRWVLTAAQCASGVTTLTVFLGANNLSASESGRLVITTTSKIVHSGFSTLSLANDIALINLGQDVTLNTYINTVPLAPGGTIVATNGTGRLSGWSSSSRDNKQTASLLRYKDMVIVPNEECNYGTTGIIRTSILCAKFADGSSTCNVGVGNPLVEALSGKQVGVLSYWHRRLCAEGAPITFTRVSSYAAWITANTGIAITRSPTRLALLR